MRRNFGAEASMRDDRSTAWPKPSPSKLAVMSIFLIQEAGGGDMMIPLAAGLLRTRLLRAAMAQRILRQPRQLRRRLQELRELHCTDRPKDRPLPRRQSDHH